MPAECGRHYQPRRNLPRDEGQEKDREINPPCLLKHRNKNCRGQHEFERFRAVQGRQQRCRLTGATVLANAKADEANPWYQTRRKPPGQGDSRFRMKRKNAGSKHNEPYPKQ